MKSVVIGAVESTAVLIRALHEFGLPPSLVVTLPHDLAANHSDFVDLESLPEIAGTTVLRESNVNSPDVIAQVAALAPDVIFVVGWSRLVKKPLQALARLGCVGYHPARLPVMRGRAALAWTIILDVRETAGTLFWIDDGIDSGDIIAQQPFTLTGREYLGDLMAAHMQALSQMAHEAIRALASGVRPARKQNHSQASYLAHRRPEDGRINWSDDQQSIWRLVRGVSRPYPGAFTTIDSKIMRIWRAQPVSHPEWHAQTGQIFLYQDGLPIVRCGDGRDLLVEEFEIEGGTAPVGQKRLGV